MLNKVKLKFELNFFKSIVSEFLLFHLFLTLSQHITLVYKNKLLYFINVSLICFHKTNRKT